MKKFKIYLVIFLISAVACNEEKNKSQTNMSSPQNDEFSSFQFENLPVCIEKSHSDINSNSTFMLDRDSLFNILNGTYVQYSILKQGKSDVELRQNQEFSAILMPYKWDYREFKVAFIGGTLKQRKRVAETVKHWENKGNVGFNFGDYKDPDISISFREGEGSWSYIGKTSKNYYPSMNFGWLKDNTPQEEYDRVVLHEFGHALGYIHEHQHPDVSIPWNRDAVYQYYRYLGWSDSQIESNIFKKYDRAILNYTRVDESSIMLYAIDNNLTNGNYSTTWNTKISVLDSVLLNIVYP